MFQNRLLRRIFGPKSNKVTGKWRRIHNKELHTVRLTKYCSGDQMMNEMGGACGTYGGEYRCTQGRPKGKRPL